MTTFEFPEEEIILAIGLLPNGKHLCVLKEWFNSHNSNLFKPMKVDAAVWDEFSGKLQEQCTTSVGLPVDINKAAMSSEFAIDILQMNMLINLLYSSTQVTHYTKSGVYLIKGTSIHTVTGRLEVFYENVITGVKYHQPLERFFQVHEGQRRFSLCSV